MNLERSGMLVFLGINAIYDLYRKEILFVPTVFYGLFGAAFSLVSGGNWESLLMNCMPGFLLLGISLLTGGKLGLGDAWILFAMGLCLGFLDTMTILWIAVLLLCVFSLALLACGKYSEGDRVTLPMVPFLFGAMMIWELVCN